MGLFNYWAGLFWFFNMLLYSGAVVLIIWRRKREPVHSRGWILALLSTTCAAWAYGVHSMAASGLLVGVTCHHHLWPSVFRFSLWPATMAMRGLTLWYKWTVQHYVAQRNLEKLQSLRKYLFLADLKFHLAVCFGYTLLWVLLFLFVYLGSWARSEPEMYVMGVYVEVEGRGLVLSCTAVPILTVVFIGQCSALLILTSVFAVLLWKAHDGFHLKTELVIVACIGLPLLLIFAGLRLIDSFTGPSDLFNYLSFTLEISMLYMAVIHTFRRKYQKWENSRMDHPTFSEYSEAQYLPKKPSMNLLEDIMESDNAHTSFHNYLMTIWCSEILEFLDEVKHFKTTQNKEEKRRSFITIMDNFVVEQAPMSINLEGTTFAHLREEHERIQSTVDYATSDDILKVAENEMKKLLLTSSLPGYLHGPQWPVTYAMMDKDRVSPQDAGLGSQEFGRGRSGTQTKDFMLVNV
eukprot:Lithocolla_globosa_v1_NODE_875_length_3150_cov_7.636834.p2 type:complete len:463 gc:universal NODE_875_length_3150_cov_7.636834:1391-3(-)